MHAPANGIRTPGLLFGALFAAILAAVAIASLRTTLDLRAAASVLALGGAAWIAAVRLAREGAGSFRIVVAGAIVLRLVALAAPSPRLSDDAYRYLWEGEVARAGFDPYRSAPTDPMLAGLRDDRRALYERVNNEEISAAYPPLVQATGTLAASIAHAVGKPPERFGVLVLRALFALCDLLVLLPIARMLARRGLPPALACAWGWSPLVATEFAGSGHFDSLGILFLVLALDRLDRDLRETSSTASHAGRSAAATVLLSAGVLVKLLPLVALPWAARARRAPWRTPLEVIAIGALAVAPFLLLRPGDRGFLDGLTEYAQRWESLNVLYRWMEAASRAVVDDDPGGERARHLARVVAALAWLAVASVTWVRCRDPIAGTARIVAAFVVLSPTLHPWYLAWMIPFVALRSSLAWLWLVGAAPLAYWPLERWQHEQVWIEPAMLWPLLVLPFLALAAHGSLRRAAQRGSPLAVVHGRPGSFDR